VRPLLSAPSHIAPLGLPGFYGHARTRRSASLEGWEQDGSFPLNESRMIKIALGVYDTLEITMGARSPTPSS
jgi:hypothetical protein